MTLATRDIIKICGLSTAPTVDVALSAGADLVGFVFFARSPRAVTPDQAAILSAPARGRAGIVALVVDEADDALDRIVATLQPDMLQLHGRETPERAAFIAKRYSIPVMKALGIGTAADLAAVPPFADAGAQILLDAKPPKESALPGGNGHVFDWSILENLDRRFPFVLSGGLEPSNVAAAIDAVRPLGVDVSSGVESAPGIKDIAKMTAFVAQARSAFRSLKGA